MLNIIKSFVVFDQIVEAAKFDVLFDIVLVDLAALKILLRALVVVVGELLEHLDIQIDPLVDFEVNLEVDGVKGERCASKQGEVLDILSVGRRVEEI